MPVDVVYVDAGEEKLVEYTRAEVFVLKLILNNNTLLNTVCLFVCLFVRLFVCSFVRLFVCSFVRLFVCSFVRLFVCSFVRLFFDYLFLVCRLTCPST